MTNSSKVKAAETALADARGVLDAKRQQLREAEQLVAKIRNAWDRGSDEYSSLDKMAAEGDVERLTKATSIASQQAKHAERRLRALSPALAERAALAIGDTVFGIEAKAVTSRPTKSTTDVQVSVVENQIYEPADDHTGGIKGRFLVVVTGPEFMGEFDGAAVGRALRQGGINLGHGHHWFRVSKDAPGVFSCEYSAEFAMPLEATIPRTLSGYLSSMLTTSSLTPLQERYYSSAANVHAFTGGAGVKHISETVADGVRTVVVDATVTLRPTRSDMTLPAVANIAEGYLRQRFADKTGFAGVGVVEGDAEISHSTTSHDNPAGYPVLSAQVTARVTLKAKVPA